MALRMSEKSKLLIDKARVLSEENKDYYLGTEHLLIVIMKEESLFQNLLARYSLSTEKVEESVRSLILTGGSPSWKGVLITPRVQKIMKLAQKEAENFQANKVEPLHILYTILLEGEGIAVRALSELGVDIKEMRELLAKTISGMKLEVPPCPLPLWAEKKEKEEERKKSPSSTPLLDRLGRDLTAIAREGKIDPLIGRKDELRRVMQILTRKAKNNPLIIGEAGVGKTAIVLGLASRIAEGQVPQLLQNKKIVELNMSSIIAGTRHRGEFEEKLEKIIKELKRDLDIILFIDEIHTIVGAGDAKGHLDASNILKPFLARGDICCIGATTTDEYRKYIASDSALERRFQPVLLSEPSEEETINILEGLKQKYEAHHGVKFTSYAIKEAVKLSVRFLPERHLPDKAIDLIDEAASRVKMRSIAIKKDEDGQGKAEIPLMEVDEEAVAEVVSAWTGIPVHKITVDEAQKLLKMEELLKKRVVGQDEAVERVSQTIRMIRVGLENPNRPGGVFLFLGPTGVGKTELAKALSEFLFGSEKAMIRLDMSEYMEKHSISRLIGAPPGYIGYEEEGQLTKAVRTKPYSVVLLDEIEKAHPEVFDLFLQVFEDGRLTDSKGRTVNFNNSIIIMTSNLGSQRMLETIREKEVALAEIKLTEEIKAELMQEIKGHFRPEFINRIDEVIIFNPLGYEELKKIIDINLEGLKQRLEEKDIHLELSLTAIDFILSKGYDPSFGARPLKRAIQTYLAKPIAEEILRGQIKEGDKIIAFSEADKIIFCQEGSN